MMGKANCLRCRFRHEDNGNCTAVGGFCTAVAAAHCPMLRGYLDTGLTPEQCENAKAIIESAFSDDTSKAERIRELLKADKDRRLVVHTRWAHLGGDEWCCPVCGFVITTEGSWDKPTKKYCEDCGAKMDGGDSDALD